MKKKIIITLIILLILIIGGLTLLFVNLNSIISNRRSDIEKMASENLGTPVKLGSLETSLIPLGIKVTNVKIGENDQQAGLNTFFISLKLLPLLSKTIDISNLNIVEPSLTLVKDKDGVYLVGLPKKGNEVKKEDKKTEKGEEKNEVVNTTPTPIAPSGDTPQPKDNPLAFVVKLNSISLSNGKLIYKDTTTNKEIVIDKLNIDTGVTLDNSKVTLPKGTITAQIDKEKLDINYSNASYTIDSSKINLNTAKVELPVGSLEVNAKLKNPTNGEVNINNLNIDLEKTLKLAKQYSGELPISELKGLILSTLHINLADNAIPTADGTLEIKDTSTTMNQIAIKDFQAKAKLYTDDKQIMEITPLKLSINDAPIDGKLKTTLKNQTVTLEDLRLSLFAGKLETVGSFHLESKNFRGKASLKDIDLNLVIKAFAPQLSKTLSGTLNSLDVNIKGVANDKLTESLIGDGTLAISNGEIKNFNIAKEVLGALSAISFAQGITSSTTIKKIMASNGTVIKNLDVASNITGSTVKINKLNLVSDFFNIEGTGIYRLNNEMDLNASIIFNPQVSLEIVSRVKELESILDQQKRLVIPLKIKGDGKSVQVLPETNELIKQSTKKVAEKGVKKLFDKFGSKFGF